MQVVLKCIYEQGNIISKKLNESIYLKTNLLFSSKQQSKVLFKRI